MKKTIILIPILIFILLLSGCLSSEYYNEDWSNMKIEISLEKSNYSINESINLKIDLYNSGSDPIKINYVESDPWYHYKITMKLPNGTNVTSPPTTSTISPTPKVFKPNERKTITIDLKTTDLYILYGNPEIPFLTWEYGEYEINVQFTSYVYKADFENEWFELNSDNITFEITT